MQEERRPENEQGARPPLSHMETTHNKREHAAQMQVKQKEQEPPPSHLKMTQIMMEQ